MDEEQTYQFVLFIVNEDKLWRQRMKIVSIVVYNVGGEACGFRKLAIMTR